MNNPLNPTMITLGRELRGLSQRSLSSDIGVTQGYLSRVEKGFVDPTDECLQSLSKKLKLPINFFYRKGDTFTPNLYYRKRSRTSKAVLHSRRPVPKGPAFSLFVSYFSVSSSAASANAAPTLQSWGDADFSMRSTSPCILTMKSSS